MFFVLFFIWFARFQTLIWWTAQHLYWVDFTIVKCMNLLLIHTSLFCVQNVDQIYPRMYLLKKTALGHLSIMHDSSTYVVRTMRSLISVYISCSFWELFSSSAFFLIHKRNKCPIYTFFHLHKWKKMTFILGHTLVIHVYYAP